MLPFYYLEAIFISFYSEWGPKLLYMELLGNKAI